MPSQRQKELKDRVVSILRSRPAYWNKHRTVYTFKWTGNMDWRTYIRICKILAPEIKSGEVNIGFTPLERALAGLFDSRQEVDPVLRYMMFFRPGLRIAIRNNPPT